MSGFDEAYKILNSRQKEAVDHIDGPLLVIAGPGTGKTQLLSVRVANILKRTDVMPDNILCLTFTDSAVNEMRSRLSSIIGGQAGNINISTYHSFGNDLIREYSEYFGGNKFFESISELESDNIIRSIQSKLDYTNTYSSERLVRDIKSRISSLKQSLIEPEDLKKIAKDNISFTESISIKTKNLPPMARVSKASIVWFEEILSWKPSISSEDSLEGYFFNNLAIAIDNFNESNKTTFLTSWKNEYLQKDDNDKYILSSLSSSRKLLDLLTIYTEYQEELNKNSFVDYDDMIIKSIYALKKYPEFKFTLQEKYQYILLDEYQDTNEAQAELVNLLVDNEVNERRPNIMAVGDDDQAIYAFQGANYSHMLEFYNNFDNTKLISLSDNYRSTSSITGLFNEIAKQIESRLVNYIEDIDKNIVSIKNSQAKSIRRVTLQNQISQNIWVAKDIKDKLKNNHSVAVISPKHIYLEEIAKYLASENIDIDYQKKENVLEDNNIKLLLNMCRLVEAINQEDNNTTSHLLSKVLNSDIYQIPVDQIWELSWTAHKEKLTWLELAMKNNFTKNICLFFYKLAKISKDNYYDTILEYLIGLKPIHLSDDEEYFSPLKKYLEKTNTDSYFYLISNLLSIRKEYESFESGKGEISLTNFIEYIDDMNTSKIKISSNNKLDQNGSRVKLLTAYSAKGLEFDEVYIIDLIDDVWGPSARSGNNKVVLPPNLKYLSYTSSDEDEKKRLLYVALSRARTNLNLVSYEFLEGNKQTKPLKYFGEFSENNEKISPYIPEGEKILSINQEITPTELEISLSTTKATINNFQGLIRNRLVDFKISPTELNTFVDVTYGGPISFYEKVILKYPSVKSPSAQYGSAIHDALEWYQKQINLSGATATIDNLLKTYKNMLEKKFFTKQELIKYLSKGQAYLKSYVKQNIKDFTPGALIEHSFRSENIQIGNAKITGKIDKILINNATKELTIVDYKTGKSFNNWSPSTKSYMYKNQLYFYKLLIANSARFKEYKIKEAYLDFIEPNEQGKHDRLKIDFNDNYEANLTKLINVVYDKVLNLEFPDTQKYSEDLSGILNFEEDLINLKT